MPCRPEDGCAQQLVGPKGARGRERMCLCAAANVPSLHDRRLSDGDSLPTREERVTREECLFTPPDAPLAMQAVRSLSLPSSCKATAACDPDGDTSFPHTP